MNDQQHKAELAALAQKIYRIAVKEISTYSEAHYNRDPIHTMSQQVEDFLVISDTTCAYLLGNALAMLPEEEREEETQLFSAHLQQVIEYAEKSRNGKA